MLFDPQDPTGTLDLRLEAYDQIENRLLQLRGVSFDAIEETNLEDENEILLLALFLKEKTNEILMESEDENNWLGLLILSSYLRGQSAAEVELSASGIRAPDLHQTKKRLAAKRALRILKGNVDLLTSQIETIINDTPLKETTEVDLKRKVEDRINKTGLSNARRTARTEIIYANQLATVTQGEAVEMLTGAEVVYRWQTRQDSKVRDTHVARNKKVYSKKAVLPLLGEPNCRCRIIPVAVDSSGNEATAFNPIFLTIPTLLTETKLVDFEEE